FIVSTTTRRCILSIQNWLMDSHHLLSFYLSILKRIASIFLTIKRFPFFVTLFDAIISVYFRFCGLSPCTVDLDDQTTMHFWTTNHRRFDKPGLVIIHGYGGNSRLQFVRQVGPLSQCFNLYVPDLLFFGKSFTNRSDRTELFQARCVCEGLKRLGVDRFSVYAISYGGFVGYRMAEICPEMVDKVVIVSSGIGCTEDQKGEQLRKLNRDPRDILLPEKPDDLRLLINLSIYKFDPFKWVPDFLLKEFINVMCKDYRKEKLELVEHILAMKADSDFPILTQETLLIWGDQDNVFPVCLAHQLQRHLGPKSKLEIIKDTGHAVNVESPDTLNHLIKLFVLGKSKFNG
ncbi:uncharacterized protein LOC132286365, partial [Cornus florida]|uniref:uncharacterized protein LOC132286365 n=1 Tax=Cornus florida TaxID=4283 RepID=UPI00289B3734